MKQTMKKVFSLFLALMMMVSVIPMSVSADETGESTEGTTWEAEANTSWYDASKKQFGIDTAEKLAGVAAIVNGTSTLTDSEGNALVDNFEGKTIVLTKDIDLSGKTWIPIGGSKTFNGIFDGNGYSISGINVSGGTYAGLFGKTSGAILKDFVISSGSVSNGTNTGAVVGSASATIIKNVSNAASVASNVNNGYLGGIVGTMDSTSSIYNCANTGTVTATASINTGGIAGESATSAMENLYNTGAITSTSTASYKYTGGIVGKYSASTRIIKNCYNVGVINGGSTKVTGIASSYSSITMENCFFLKDAGATYANIDKKEGADFAKTEEELKGEDVLNALGDAYVADTAGTLNQGYPVLKWQSEELVRGYASDIVIYYDTTVRENLVTDFEHNKFEYTIKIPANISTVYVGGAFRADAPDDAQATIEYYNYFFKQDNAPRDLTDVWKRGNQLYVSDAVSNDGTNTPTTYKINVGVDDDIQTYTIHVVRIPVIKSVSLADKDGVALKVETQDEKEIYEVPVDTAAVEITVDATDAALTVNGQEAVNREVLKVTPEYDTDGYAEVTVVAAYNDRTVTKTYTLHQDVELASVYEEAAASRAEAEAAKAEAEAAKAEAEAAKAEAEAAKNAALEAAEAAKAAKEALEQNATAENEKAAAKAEAEAAKKAEEAAKAEAEAAKAEAVAAKAEAEAAKAETETAKAELTKAQFNSISAKITSVKGAKKKITVTWKKVSSADGYVVYRSTKKNTGFKAVKTIKKVSTVKWTNTKLKSGKEYYYKVRAYKVVNGKKVFSKYSTVKSVKAK